MKLTRCFSYSYGKPDLFRVSLAAGLVLATFAQATAQLVGEMPDYECGYHTPDEVMAAIRDAVQAGEIADPAKRVLPPIVPIQAPRPMGQRGTVPTVTTADIFPFEDTNSLLLTNFSQGQLFNLMAQGTNALLASHGDNYDFIGFFLNFTPNHTIGSAFYLGLFNDTTGIGQGTFNQRAGLGVNGNKLQGWVMAWNQGSWGPNTTTMLVFGQEFEHRWAMFLAPLLDGRALQGNNSGCGRSSHWNWKVDGQGSGMEIREWIGSNPATLGGTCAPGGFFFICFNSDVGTSPGGLGGVWSYTDLYLMGYASPAEMDAGNSELRYMNTSNCSSAYSGTITSFSNADIVAANGVRSPDSTQTQKNFRTGWVMFHLPGSPPNAAQLDNSVNILNRWSDTWDWSSLGRGTMDNTLVQLFRITFPNGTPTTLIPNHPQTFDVATIPEGGTPNTSSGLLHYSVNGGAYSAIPIAYLGGNDYRATLPGFACNSNVAYYVTIDAVVGGSVTGPAGAPGVTLQASTVEGNFLVDNFETDLGWTVSGNATDGVWARVTPNGGVNSPTTDFDGVGARRCWVTKNGIFNADVDGGTTILTSPIFDLTSLTDPYVSYARWYANVGAGAAQADVFVIEVSEDGGGSWVNLETVGPTTSDLHPEVTGGWFLKTYRVSDFITPTNQFRIRYLASDLGADSNIEAGLDDFRIVECAYPCPGHTGDMNGDSTTDGRDIAPFVDAMIAGTIDPVVVCPADYNDNVLIDEGDIDPFVAALLVP